MHGEGMVGTDRVLSKEATRRLLRQAQQGDTAARQQLIEANLRLVRSVARRFSHRADGDDLFQVGCIGLMHAIDKFDLTYDVQFSTYAVPLIMGEMRRFIRDDRTVRVTRHGLDLGKRAEETRQRLQHMWGRSPTPAEIGTQLGVAKEEVIAALDALAPPMSLDEPTGGGSAGSSTRLDQLRSRLESPEEEVIESMALQHALDSLVPSDRQLIVWRFLENRRQTEVASLLGKSQPHVSRMERRILLEMRKHLSS